MSINYKKEMLKTITYIDKKALRHKHNYTIKCILEITNQNIHAQASNYKSKEYYRVLKCDMCNSFVADSKEGNYNGHISSNDNSLPLIIANTKEKTPIYNFSKLYNVIIKKS